MPAKKRPRNPLKPYRGQVDPSRAKPPEEFTGIGDETISGKGGGVLRFSDGKLVASHPATLARRWTVEDSVRCLRIRGSLGLPIDSASIAEDIPPAVRELLSIPDLAIMAFQMIEAIHAGDAELFRRISKIVASPTPETDPNNRASLIHTAIHEAATECGGIPTREHVAKILGRMTDPSGMKMFTTAGESDKVQAMLESVGFGWLPHKAQGEHLRRNTPKLL